MNEMKKKQIKMAIIIAVIVLFVSSILYVIAKTKDTKEQPQTDTSDYESGSISSVNKTPSVNNSSDTTNDEQGIISDFSTQSAFDDGDLVEEGSNYTVHYDAQTGGFNVEITGEDIINETELPFGFVTYVNNLYEYCFSYPENSVVEDNSSQTLSFSHETSNIGVSVITQEDIPSLNNMNSGLNQSISDVSYIYNGENYSYPSIKSEWKGFLATKNDDDTRARNVCVLSFKSINSKKTLNVNCAAYYIYDKTAKTGITVLSYGVNDQEMLNYLAYTIANSIKQTDNITTPISFSTYTTDTDIDLKYPSTWDIDNKKNELTMITAPSSSTESYANCCMFYMSDTEQKYVSDCAQYSNSINDLLLKHLLNGSPSADGYTANSIVENMDITKIYGHDAIIYDISFEYTPLSLGAKKAIPNLGCDMKMKMFCFTKSGSPCVIGFVYNSTTEEKMNSLIDTITIDLQ